MTHKLHNWIRNKILKNVENYYITTHNYSFKHKDIEIKLCYPLKTDILSTKNLIFGKTFSDHMLDINWTEKNGWGTPKILPYKNLTINPAVKALHYAIQLFDGLKAYRGIDNKIRLFRPQLNIQRILKGTERLALPVKSFDPSEFLECIKTLVNIEKNWVPRPDSNLLNSLYIRPTYLGTEPTLGVASSTSAQLYVITSPVGSYYANGSDSIALYTDARYVRAWPGGVGDIKLGSNYAPTVYLQKKACENGCQQVLWLYGPDRQITEVGTMNTFMLWENCDGKLELITAPLNGLILPGITRLSILELARSWEFEVSEKVYTMGDLLLGIKENRVKEFFGTGTAVVITPVHQIMYEGVRYEIPTTKGTNPLYTRLFKALMDIHSGKVASPWTCEI
ncbi:branched-chain-amino-acid aminotransferase, cytosolic-like isoform X2 [Gordionus sp. m RMFG-2023]|uniref:branched-chain-amino-acid aminotransferase, cytosolic-like isoform X2 n=1 Tax=Gordionus sp. m RMFG-2023 TaxID=3053472 RepID=UPI0031FC4D0E